MLRTVFDKCIFFFGLINIQNEEGLLLFCGHLSSHKDDLCRQFKLKQKNGIIYVTDNESIPFEIESCQHYSR